MSAGWLVDLVLVLGILGVAGFSVVVRQGFAAVAGFVAYGLLLALAWVRLGSVDVALTEAAIGAGLSGMVLLGAVARTAGRDQAPPPGRLAKAALAVLSAGVAGLLALAVLTLPAPPPSLAAAAAAPLPALGLGNPVTGVLLAYRALDTLLEAVVLVFAVLAVWALAPDGLWGARPGPPQPRPTEGALLLLARLLPPIGLVIGVHIVWTGAEAPGGAFQGGTVLAAMWLLAWMAGLVRPPAITSRALRLSVAIGPLVFVAVGALGAVVAGAVLAYPAGLAKPLILLIEAALAWSIAVALALLVLGPPEPARP